MPPVALPLSGRRVREQGAYCALRSVEAALRRVHGCVCREWVASSSSHETRPVIRGQAATTSGRVPGLKGEAVVDAGMRRTTADRCRRHPAGERRMTLFSLKQLSEWRRPPPSARTHPPYKRAIKHCLPACFLRSPASDVPDPERLVLRSRARGRTQ